MLDVKNSLKTGAKFLILPEFTVAELEFVNQYFLKVLLPQRNKSSALGQSIYDWIVLDTTV